MKKFLSVFLLFFVFVSSGFSQMWNGQDTLYGNEWINYDQTYFKFLVSEDGIYRISKQVLEDAGVPINEISGDQIQIFNLGEEVPLYASSDGAFGDSDYVEFYGKQNRTELDRYVYPDPDYQMINPYYSNITDTAAYFLTWNELGGNSRFSTMDNDLNNLPPKEEYFVEEQKIILTDSWEKKKTSQSIFQSFFEVGEGWSSGLKNTQMHVLQVEAPYLGGEDANLHVRYGTGLNAHQQSIKIGGVEVANDSPVGYSVITHDFSIPNSELDADIEISFTGLIDEQDKQMVSNLILTYPRLFDFSNNQLKLFKISPSASKKYIEIENFDSDANEVFLYDLTNERRMLPIQEGGVWKVALEGDDIERTLVLVSNNGVKAIDNLKGINFINYSGFNEDYLIISHQNLMDDGAGNNYVQDYANYRASVEGGSFDPIIIDIDQLTNQYAYGVERHPLSIRNFTYYLKKIGAVPDYVFLMGKGREYNTYRKETSLNDPNALKLLIPTFGFPGADNLLFSDNETATPLIPNGRLAATSPDEVRIYLKKVQDFEDNVNVVSTIEGQSWMKRIIHLGGGATTGEQTSIKNGLNQMKDVIERNTFGGEVHSFFKTSSSPVQESITDQIFDLINDGVSIITFFGHSGANTFDFNIDNPENYFNQDKYPVMFSLGCFIGNVNTSFKGVSERFVFDEEASTIAFAASSSQGFIGALRNYMVRIYQLLGEEMYGMRMGDIIKESVRHFDNGNFGTYELAQQFIWHGDPALRLNPFDGPDFVIDPSSVSFDPPFINTVIDSFTLGLDMMNIGKGVEDSVRVRIEQELPDGSIFNIADYRIASPLNRTTLFIRVPTLGKSSVGLNKIHAVIDYPNDIEEAPVGLAENNNELIGSGGEKGIKFFIQDNGIVPVYPPEFAIVNDANVSLHASTSNALAQENRYVIEIDTTAEFNSPMLLRNESTQIGGVLKWQPSLDWEEERVYYWRVSPDSISQDQGYTWSSSSFVYVSDSGGGWNQSHRYQYEKDEFNLMVMDTVLGGPNFALEYVGVRIKNKIFDWADEPRLFWNGAPTSVKPWHNPANDNSVCIFIFREYDYSLLKPPGSNDRFKVFHTSQFEEREAMIDYIESYDDGYYVGFMPIMYSTETDIGLDDWAQDSVVWGYNIFSYLEAQGATLVRALEEIGTAPYIFVYQKNRNKVIAEEIMPPEGTSDVEFTLSRRLKQGVFRSTVIGPAPKWDNLIWEIDESTLTANDQTWIQLLGLNTSGSVDTLISSQDLIGEVDLADIDVNVYPRLRLEYEAQDEVLRSAPYLKKWRIEHEESPDLAIDPSTHLVFYRDTLEQGDEFRFETAIRNISAKSVTDSLNVRFTSINALNEEEVFVKRIPPIDVNEVVLTDFSISTRSLLGGNHKIIIEVNPEQNPAEILYSNNLAIARFWIESDKRNPVLDVTFDGVHIMDGDIVSVNPKIEISLEDENEYLELGDTSLFRMYLKYPEEAEPRNISFLDDDVQFFPASLNSVDDKNRAKIELSPSLVKTGVYELTIQAEDQTGNASGDKDYKISFEVINEELITNLLNYPNPFSTSTQFVYTLTGSEAPEFFKIQIMTVSGRVVKEITQDELGPLKIGTHKTDYAWDGTDEFGDKLANGIYLYRVVAKNANMEDFGDFDEYRETGTDQFFKNGFGKMVLIR